MAVLFIVPILLPLLNQVGIDLVHFGFVVVLNPMIGLITPPVGILLYLTSSMAEVKLELMLKELPPFFIALLLVLAVFTFVPDIVLWPPNLVMK